VANANRAGTAKHVFGIVADPAGAGVGIDRDDPMKHPPHLVGIGTFLPVKPAFELARQFNPALKTIGVVWNPGESNSEAFTKKAREACAEMGLELREATIENSSGVLEAASSLVSRGVDALWVGGDVTVMVALDSVVAAARKGHIPVFSIVPPAVDRGALFDFGANFYEVGKDVGALAADVLRGADMTKIPIRNFVPERILINMTALKGLRQQWRFPDAFVAKADVIIDDTGRHQKPHGAAK
jgi:putative ABC transport system substrate-binding protein